ncbi:Peroxidase-like protein 3 [Elsinoe fawcettii]|nr:Peroxidase-like protein 3 [Elsinoe fawcettii]
MEKQSDPTPSSETKNPWSPSKPGEARSPCPGLNTLANHEFFPHDGRNIDHDTFLAALKNCFNIGPQVAETLFQRACKINPAPGATDFNLDHLSREGTQEHDASLSRVDRHFGDSSAFNEEKWANTSKCFVGDHITVQQLVAARQHCLKLSRETNPEQKFSSANNENSWGECASILTVMASGTAGGIDRAIMDYFFRNERLPIELGWKRRETEIEPPEVQASFRTFKDTASMWTENGDIMAKPYPE